MVQREANMAAMTSVASRPERHVALAVLVSAVAWCLLGGGGVFFKWQVLDSRVALPRGLLCAALIAVVHWIGYGFFVRWREIVWTEDLRSVLRGQVAIQVAMLFLGAILLDGGWFLRMCAMCALVHWLLVGLILSRRWPTVTRVDRALLAAGFFVAPFLLWAVGAAGKALGWMRPW
jgi:hypothetical protein